MREKGDKLGRRVLSSVLAFLLVVSPAINSLQSITAFAAETGSKKKNVFYEYHEEAKVHVGVMSENESFMPGEQAVFKVYVRNNSHETISGGTLKWNGVGLEDTEFFGFTEEQTESEHEAGFEGQRESLAEEEGKAIKEIELAPGEIFEAELWGVIERDLEKVRTRKITFTFEGKNEVQEKERAETIFTYNTGMFSLMPVEFNEDNAFETNEENLMYIHTVFQDEGVANQFSGPAFGDDVISDEDRVTILDPDDTNLDHATDSNADRNDDNDIPIATPSDAEVATPSDADRDVAIDTDKATPSDADREYVTFDEENATPSDADRDRIDKATPSDADIIVDNNIDHAADPEEEEEDDEESKEVVNFDLENIRYEIKTYGAQLKGVIEKYREVGGNGDVMTAVAFRVANGVEPGTYFGTITAVMEHDRKSYESTQGFFFYVTGDGEMTLKSSFDGATVEVKGDASSFPEGEVLRLKVSEVSEEQEPVLAEAMAKKEEETGISVNRMKALDIKVMADGEEQELTGPVTVTFTDVELEPVAEAVAMALETETETAAGTETKTVQEIEDGENLAVWHLDETAVELNDMGGRVEDGSVVMDTDHFSVFVIVTGNTVPDDGYHLIFEHWMNAGGTTPYIKQYKDSWPADVNGKRIRVGKNFRISDFVREGNYQLVSIELYEMVMEKGQPKINEDGSFLHGDQPYKTVQNQPGNVETEISLEKDTVVVLRYQPKAGEYTTDVRFYDYDVGQTYIFNNGVKTGEVTSPEGGINSPSNYSGGTPNRNLSDRDKGKPEPNNAGQWLSVGTAEKSNYPLANVTNPITYQATQGSLVSAPTYHLYLKDGRVNSKYRPDANGGSGSKGDTTIKEGIIKELSGSNYENVVFGTNRRGEQIYDPGLFTDDERIGKDIYDNYDLIFKQEGDAYKLSKVINNHDNSTTTAATNNLFFPLDRVAYGQLFYKDGYARNFFFGMRYDFQFELGDYIGDLNYSFTGDDDVWVFLDGQLILDLGGIHTIYPNPNKDLYPDYWRNDVNLWSFLNGNTYENYDKDAKYDPELATTDLYTNRHQITVLYIERGGGDSNCGMEFKIPNLTPVNITTTETHPIDLTIEKEWCADNIAVSSIKVQILQDGKKYREVTLNSASQWKRTETGLPDKHTYTVEEITKLSGYDSTVSYSDDGRTATIKNIQKGDLTVKKVWEDDNNKEGTRPDSIQVRLYKQIEGQGERILEDEVSVKASESWRYVWKGKHFYTEDNKKIVYMVEEVPSGWLKTQDNPDGWYSCGITGSQETGFTLTNTYTPQNDVVKKIRKVWNDDNDRFGLRPASLTIKLKRNGKDYEKFDITSQGDWAHVWENLPRYSYTKKNGIVSRIENVYTVEEDYYPGKEYYKAEYTINGTDPTESIITNTLQTAKFTVKKAVTSNNSAIPQDDQFIIKVTEKKKDNPFVTNVVLKNGAQSEEIEVPFKTTGDNSYVISEIMPKEYSRSKTFLTATGQIGVSDDVITLTGSQGGIVTVHNQLTHTGYFHGSSEKTNTFPANGRPEPIPTADIVRTAIVPEREEGNGNRLDEDERLM